MKGQPVSTIRNLGPASEASYGRAGIHTAQQLRELGADEAYRRLLAAGTKPHFIGYYALVMGLQGRPWNDCQGKEKERLRKAFDELCAESARVGGAPPGIEKMLDRIGVVAPGRKKGASRG